MTATVGAGEQRLAPLPGPVGLEEAVVTPVLVGRIGHPIDADDFDDFGQSIGYYGERATGCAGHPGVGQRDQVARALAEALRGLLADDDLALGDQAPPVDDREVGAGVLPEDHRGGRLGVGFEPDDRVVLADDLREAGYLDDGRADVGEVWVVGVAAWTQCARVDARREGQRPAPGRGGGDLGGHDGVVDGVLVRGYGDGGGDREEGEDGEGEGLPATRQQSSDDNLDHDVAGPF